MTTQRRPCDTPHGGNTNVCVAEGCFGQACIKSDEAGVWVSYSYDVGPIDVRPHRDEMAARRYADDDMPGYGMVVFLRFGEDVREAEKRQKKICACTEATFVNDLPHEPTCPMSN